ASTARTPSSLGPFAAQSRDEPEPYSLPATTINGVASARYRCAASKIVISSPLGTCTVHVPSEPGTSRLRSRTFANVPRTSTSWLPRREPYELKSERATPWSCRYVPAGESGLIEPAGEMWSVVTESPSETRQRAPEMSPTVPGSRDMASKYGGLRT